LVPRSSINDTPSEEPRDQIVRDLTLADNARKAREAVECVRRHLPDGLDRSMFFSEQPDVSQDDPYGEAMGETFGY
jgi:hypothetical protein